MSMRWREEVMAFNYKLIDCTKFVLLAILIYFLLHPLPTFQPWCGSSEPVLGTELWTPRSLVPKFYKCNKRAASVKLRHYILWTDWMTTIILYCMYILANVASHPNSWGGGVRERETHTHTHRKKERERGEREGGRAHYNYTPKRSTSSPPHVVLYCITSKLSWEREREREREITIIASTGT